MEKYSLVLKNDRLKQYDRLALLILLINFAVLLFLLFSSTIRSVKIASLMGTVGLAIVLSIHFFLKRIRHNQGSPYLHAGFFLVFLSWLLIGNYIIVAVIVVLQLLYQVSKKQAVINVFENEIVYTAFPARTFSWKELSNVLLKDGILTLDFKNNRIIQHEIVNSNRDVNEPEFNEFCRRHLQSAVA
jgi:hypothetical protein